MPTKDYYMQEWIDNIFNPPIVPIFPLEKPQTVTKKSESLIKVVNPFEIQSVLSNHKKNAFTVVWTDGTHTTVHCQSGDDWDDEKALAMCFTKKALGNKGNFNDKFNDALENKMKVIHMEKTNTPLQDSMETLQKSAEKVTHSFKELIGAISENKNENENTYKAYFKNRLIAIGTVKELSKHIRSFINRQYPCLSDTPVRVWNSCNEMYIDFGSSNYITIPNMSTKEWFANK